MSVKTGKSLAKLLKKAKKLIPIHRSSEAESVYKKLKSFFYEVYVKFKEESSQNQLEALTSFCLFGASFMLICFLIILCILISYGG